MKPDPTLQTRRQFLRTSALGAAATWTLPVFIEKTFFALNALTADAWLRMGIAEQTMARLLRCFSLEVQ